MTHHHGQSISPSTSSCKQSNPFKRKSEKVLQKKRKEINSCTLWWCCSHGYRGSPDHYPGSCSRRSRVESRAQCSSAAHRSWCSCWWPECAGWSPIPAQTPLRPGTQPRFPCRMIQPVLNPVGGETTRQHGRWMTRSWKLRPVHRSQKQLKNRRGRP